MKNARSNHNENACWWLVLAFGVCSSFFCQLSVVLVPLGVLLEGNRPEGITAALRAPVECAQGLLAAQIRPFVALLIQSGDLQAAGIASAYGSRAGAVGPQCLKLRLHLVACRAVQRPERRTGAMQRSCESSLRMIFRSGRLPRVRRTLEPSSRRCERSAAPRLVR